MKNIISHFKIKSPRESILKYGICLLVLLLPLVVFPNYFFYYISSKTFFFYGVISILFPIWLYTIYIDKSYSLSKKQLLFFIPLVLYIVWMTLSGVLAVNTNIAFWSTFERGTGLITLYFALASAFMLASVLKREGISYLNLILKFLLVSSFILSITVWLSDRGFDSSLLIFKFSSGGGLTGNSSVSSVFLIFAIFSGIYLLITNSVGKYWKIAIYIILMTILLSPSFINIYGIYTKNSLVEFSKGSLIGLFVGVGVAGLSYLALSNKKKIRNFGIAGFFIILIIFSFGWANLVTPGTYLHEKFIEYSLNTRFILWEISEKTINEHPFFGYGPENLYITFQDKFNPKLFQSEFYNETINDRAHNFYYDNGVSGGYPGILLYILVFLTIFYAIYEVYKNKSITRLHAGIFAGLFSAYLFQNLFFFDSNISIFYFYAFIGIVFGMLEHHKIEHIKDNILIKKVGSEDSKAIVLILVAISFASLFYLVILPSKKAILMQSVVNTYFMENKFTIYDNLLKTAHIGNDRDVAALSDIMFRQYIYNLTHSVYKEYEIRELENEVRYFYNYLNTVAKTNANDIRLQIGLLRFNSIYYYLTNKEISSDSMMIVENAHRQSPTNPEIYWWEAQIDFWHGDNASAIDSYKKAINLNPNFVTSHKMLLQFCLDIKDKKTYDEALIKAKNDIPGFNF